MHRYRINHKIWTVAELDGAQTIEGFEMRAIDNNSLSSTLFPINDNSYSQ